MSLARARGATGGTLAVLALLACGAPTRSPAETIGSVPYQLSAPSSPAGPTTTPTPARGSRVYLVRDELLVRADTVADGVDARATVARALHQLADGPTEHDRTEGMSTALGPDVRLSLVNLSDGRAVVDIRAGQRAPGGSRLPLAVGQLVLTLTSVDGVDQVVLTSDGRQIAAPLPGGQLTEQPLRARDYREVVAMSTSS